MYETYPEWNDWLVAISLLRRAKTMEGGGLHVPILWSSNNKLTSFFWLSLLRFHNKITTGGVANTTATACPSTWWIVEPRIAELTRKYLLLEVKLQWQCLSSVSSFYLSSARFTVLGLRTWQRPGTPRYHIIHKSLEHSKTICMPSFPNYQSVKPSSIHSF